MIGPVQRLDHRGLRHSHQKVTPGGYAAGGWPFQHQPFCTRGMGAERGDCSGLGGGGPGGHDWPLYPTEQAVVEGWPHMGYALGRLGGALLDQLHPGHK